jgi:hypothetical protein
MGKEGNAFTLSSGSSYIAIDGQSTSSTWCRAHDQISIFFGSTITFFLLHVGAPSLKKGRVSNLQCNHTLATVEQDK